MPARLTLHPPERASRFLVIRDGQSLVVGRDPACELVLEDPRVSKRHARLEWNGAGWSLEDVGSKNGTSVDGVPASGAPLKDDQWISFGGLRARFERISEEQLQASASQRLARLQTTVVGLPDRLNRAVAHCSVSQSGRLYDLASRCWPRLVG